ncbi:MAG: hypothetical protein U0794_20410 [Isosphaeraceae bacterium]
MTLSSRDAWDATEPATLPAVCPPDRGTDMVLWSEWQLVQNRYTALHGVVFEDRGETVRLGGRVPSYYLKQVALAAACGLAGSRPIINEIEVTGSTRSCTHLDPSPP